MLFDNKYKVIAEIGQGGYGKVFHVEDENGKPYALKKFQINQGGTPSAEELDHFTKRFEREVITQQGFDSPNIVKILDYHFDTDPMYYIMDLAIYTLKDELDLGKLTDAEKINIIYDILNGLEAIHDLGLCHRDLKPSNVLKFNNGNGGFYYSISDFGLISKSNNSSTSLTLTGTQKSDDHYTAIELHIDFKKATLKSDIYSIGCIIHDLFFPSEPRPPMREINSSNSIWKDILLRCTKDAANERYDSIEELRNDIFDLNLNDNKEGHEIIDDFEFLDTDEYLTVDVSRWDKLLKKIEEDDETAESLHFKIESKHIVYLININYDKLDYLAEIHSKWISKKSFNFSYCDILAYKIKLLYESTEPKQTNIGTKIQCLLALLYLGTSHNRWYVERMFAGYASDSDLNENVAKRLALEFKLSKSKIYSALQHLNRSINFDLNTLNPIILQGYKTL